LQQVVLRASLPGHHVIGSVCSSCAKGAKGGVLRSVVYDVRFGAVCVCRALRHDVLMGLMMMEFDQNHGESRFLFVVLIDRGS
jgi:hypothetical protein